MAHRRRINPGLGGLRNRKTIPDEDKQFLREMGFDVAAYVGEGMFGCVFNGICNINARKRIFVGPDERQEVPDFTYFDPFSRGYVREISLHGKPCAIKKFFDSEDWTDLSHNEAKTLIDLDHPNIVEVYAVCKSKSSIYIIMEFLNGGSLRSFLEETKLDEPTAYHLIKQMTAGLQYLHNENKVHGDLHNENVMLSFEGNDCLCKIVDFGSCTPLTNATKKYDFENLVNLFDEVIDSTNVKTTIPENLKALELSIIGGSINDMNQIADQLSRILPKTKFTKDSSLVRFSKLFVRK